MAAGRGTAPLAPRDSGLWHFAAICWTLITFVTSVKVNALPTENTSMTPAEGHQKLLTLCQSGQFETALPLAETLTRNHPKQPAFWHLLGGICTELGNLTDAESAYQSAITLNAQDAVAHYNLGCVFQRQTDFSRAVDSFTQSLKVAPENAKAYNNLGTSLRSLKKTRPAIAAFEAAIQQAPNYVDARFNLAGTLRDAGQLQTALDVCSDILNRQPDHIASQLLLLRIKGQVCDFSAYSDFMDLKARGALNGANLHPFSTLHLETSADLQSRHARNWVSRNLVSGPKPNFDTSERAKLRIGFFSASLTDHPIMVLTTGLFRELDTQQFDVFVYNFRPKADRVLPREFEMHDQRYFNVDRMRDDDVVALAKKHSLDIAIDLDGHTRHARLGIFAKHVAPLQVTYLGFPGTSGASFFDYVIADPFVITADDRATFVEHIATLPHCYQATDNARIIADTSTTRADFGLPDDGVVFCCFNNSNKIGPTEFSIWMRILKQIEGSVLWLLNSNDIMQQNLSREAENRGIAANRLVFADKVPQAEHLARHKHADLFVDTFIYNAHTTASDALWAGLPLVTCEGTQFASRVAASILRAANLPELITHSHAEYEALILDLARDPERRADLKQRLAAQRDKCPLFDTPSHTRSIEAALKTMHARRVNGLPPADFAVPKNLGAKL